MKLVYFKSLNIAFDVESVEAILPVKDMPDECVIWLKTTDEINIKLSVEAAFDEIAKATVE